MYALEIDGLNKRYKNGRGIWDIHLNIGQGQIFGFLGPNGSGKTTTLKIIAGLLKKDSGTVRIHGMDVEEEFEKAMAKTTFMFESIVHYDNMTAYENLRQMARYYPAVTKERIDKCLQMVGILKNKDEKVGKFSLGMRQRLALAGAMLPEPALMILDEPLNGLDIEGMIEIRNIIIELARQQKTTFLISSHMSTEIEKTCTHVGVIKDGLLINTGRIDEILEQYPTVEDYFVTQVNLYKRS